MWRCISNEIGYGIDFSVSECVRVTESIIELVSWYAVCLFIYVLVYVRGMEFHN